MADLKALADAVISGDQNTALEITKAALEEGTAAKDVLDNGLIAGMDIVGARFKKNEVYIPEVLISARAMKMAMEVLEPELVKAGVEPVGRLLIGTVQGDLHDIGKNLVSMLCEGSGFEIIDIGFNAEPEKFIEAIKEHQPKIVGMSAMLTTTMRAMGHTIKAIEEAGLRDQVKIMVGGAPVDKEFADRIGSDGYGSNAPSGSDLAKQLVGVA